MQAKPSLPPYNKGDKQTPLEGSSSCAKMGVENSSKGLLTGEFSTG